MIFGAIVAGGVGSRMKISKYPKQFLPLGNSKKPILIHTLEKFILCDKLDAIYIGVHKDWIDYAEELIAKYGLSSEKIVIVEGGKDRNLTIMNIIDAIEEKYGESENHILATHDAVRPFVTLKMIEDSIEAAIECGASDTVISAVDTIVESTNHEFITSIPNRANMYQGQTPQGINMKKFKKLYYDLSEEEKNIMTDACKVFVARNQPVKLVEGDVLNMKITTANDYKIANIIFEAEKND